MLTADNLKACQNVLTVMNDIIALNLPYDQRVMYQEHSFNESEITTYEELKKSGRKCCLLGYVTTTKEWKELELNNNFLLLSEHVGFSCENITAPVNQMNIHEAKTWFLLAMNKAMHE